MVRWVDGRAARGGGAVAEHIGLHSDHNGLRAARLRRREGIPDPPQVRGVTRRIFRVGLGLRAVLDIAVGYVVVVAAGDVDTDVGHWATRPSHVFRVLRALSRQLEGTAPQAPVIREEDLAEVVQPVDRIECGPRRGRPVAVCPLVVTGNVDNGVPELVEQIQGIFVDIRLTGFLRGTVNVSVARLATVLDITVEDGERQVVRIHVGDYMRILQPAVGAVWHVAEKPDLIVPRIVPPISSIAIVRIGAGHASRHTGGGETKCEHDGG